MILDDKIPKIFGHDELQFIDENGRTCERCNRKMQNHKYVVLDEKGNSIWCSVIYLGPEEGLV